MEIHDPNKVKKILYSRMAEYILNSINVYEINDSSNVKPRRSLIPTKLGIFLILAWLSTSLIPAKSGRSLTLRT